MSCTYCKNPKHTKRECEEISKDFEIYQRLTEVVRREYVDRLTSLGLVPNTLVRTYRRSGGGDTARISGLGFVDLFSCYTPVGRKWVGASSPTGENIVLDDDDERMVTPNHCYEILEAGDGSYDEDWITQQALNEKVFRTLYKKRHIAFEMSVLNCVVKRLAQKTKTVDEMIAKMKVEEAPEVQKTDESQAGSVYVVTATSHTDDYKRRNTSVESKAATSYDNALSIAAQMLLERAEDWDSFYGEEEALEEFAACVCDATDEILASAICNFFWDHETLFAGDYVPVTFEVSIKEERSFRVPVPNLRLLSNEIVERLEEK